MIRPDFRAVCVEGDDTIRQHVIASRGIPIMKLQPPHDIPLAVVGGGASSLEHLEELKNWPGHIWAVNQGAQWLAKQGRSKDVWMFSISPTSRIATYLDGVDRAILASQCHPDVFQGLGERGAEIVKFHLWDGCGPSSVANIIMPAAMLGYQHMTFYGCEGSFKDGVYFYRDELRLEQFVVRAGGLDYLTTPDLYLTTLHLAGLLAEFPDRASEKSGGMLRAMMQDPQWHVVAWSEALRDRIMPESTEPYAPVPH